MEFYLCSPYHLTLLCGVDDARVVHSYIEHIGCSVRVVQLSAFIIGFFKLGAQSFVLRSLFVTPRSLTLLPG